jgi:hypothetical protein
MNRFHAVIFIVLVATLDSAAQFGGVADFLDVISNRSAAGAETPSSTKTGSSFANVCPIDKSVVAKRVLSEYGAMFVSSEKVTAPPTCLFRDDAEVSTFRSSVGTGFVIINGFQVQLQKPAADALNGAIADSLTQGVRIHPLDGAVAAGRSYSDSVRLWNSRFEPALRYWTRRGRISADDASAVAEMPLEQQIEKVIEWEDQGMRFGTNRANSIFASTAPPGASQHLSLLAIDIAPPITPTIIALMNSHGWFQTVKGDRPHFTYLGLTEKELPGRGLKALVFDGTQYWVPNISLPVVANP